MSKKHSVVIIDGGKEKSATLTIESWGFVTQSGLTSGLERNIYKWEHFDVFSIEGPEQLEKRITATRLLAIGIFAFAFKKAKGESFIFAETKARGVLIIKFEKKSEPQLKALFAPYRNQLPSK